MRRHQSPSIISHAWVGPVCLILLSRNGSTSPASPAGVAELSQTGDGTGECRRKAARSRRPGWRARSHLALKVAHSHQPDHRSVIERRHLLFQARVTASDVVRRTRPWRLVRAQSRRGLQPPSTFASGSGGLPLAGIFRSGARSPGTAQAVWAATGVAPASAVA